MNENNNPLDLRVGQSSAIDRPETMMSASPILTLQNTTDSIDRVGLANLTAEIQGAAQTATPRVLKQLLAQGARGFTSRRIIATEIELARIQLRVFEGMLHSQLGKLDTSPRAERLIKLFGKLTHQAHCRLLATIDQLARLEGSTPNIHIEANQAAVLFCDKERP